MTLAAIAACAMFLAACGGDDDSSSSSSTGDTTALAPGTSGTDNDEAADAEETSEETSGEEGETTTPDEEGESSGESTPGGGSDGSSATKEGSPKKPKHSDLPDRGEVSSQSAAFQQYSRPGKLHLAEFGEEAASTDFNEVNEVVVGYLEAAGAEEWERACGYLLPVVKAQAMQLAKAAKEPVGDGCGPALAVFANTQFWKEANGGTPIYASEGISSLRMKEGGLARGGAGFALFHGSDGEDHWMALKFEGGGWGLLSTSPQPFL